MPETIARYLRWAAAACLIVQPAIAQEWIPREQLRLGSLDEPSTSFGRITTAAIDATNRIYVVDALAQNARVFSPGGRLERTIGRRGKGPGEFEGVSRLGFTNDRLWVSDGALNRVVFFTLDGRPDSTSVLRFVPPPGFGGSAPAAVTRDGNFIFVPAVDAARMVAGRRLQLPVLRMRAAGMLDTLYSVEIANVGISVETPRGPVIASRPLVDRPQQGIEVNGNLFAIADAGPVTRGSSPRVRLTTRDGNGTILGQRDVPYEPQPVARAWRDSVVNRFAMVAAPDPQGQQLMRSRFADAFDIPATFPPVERVLMGSDRTVWVKLAGPGSTATWLIFDDRARPLGRVNFPRGLNLVYARRSDVLGVGTGPDDEPIIIRYTLTKP